MPSPNRTIETLQAATLKPSVISAAGAGKAFQSVAQSGAIAIQDAADYLRYIETVSATAQGVAIAQMLANPPEAELYKPILTAAQGMATSAATFFSEVGSEATTVVNEFPKGGSG